MASFLGFVQRVRQMNNPPMVENNPDALRFGILGAANIGPNGLFIPAKTHADIVVQSVAARDPAKASKYAQEHGIPNVKGSYQEMLDDPEIDCVYIALPNTLHFEWAMRSLEAGKHVLLEKPSVINAAEAESLFSQPSPTTVLLEATHSLFHPAFATFMSYLTPGDVVWARSCILAPRGVWPADDMRFNYDLGGGALADMGPYTLGALLKIFGTMPAACEESTMKTHANGIDESCKARFRFPNGGIGEVYVNLKSSWLEGISPDAEAKMRPAIVNAEYAGVKIHEGQEVVRTRHVYFKNFALPTSYHYIQVSDEYVVRKVGDGSATSAVKRWKASKTVKAYTWKQAGVEQPGEEYYTTWRYMLEQFVNKVRGNETAPGTWLNAQFSINVARMIDMAYSAAGLYLRPSKDRVHS
ncbi:NAD(P)-binding protein [Xylaria acuta]|nr:NAD(P)-binding protein [Xylaria acuta]